MNVVYRLPSRRRSSTALHTAQQEPLHKPVVRGASCDVPRLKPHRSDSSGAKPPPWSVASAHCEALRDPRIPGHRWRAQKPLPSRG